MHQDYWEIHYYSEKLGCIAIFVFDTNNIYFKALSDTIESAAIEYSELLSVTALSLRVMVNIDLDKCLSSNVTLCSHALALRVSKVLY